MIASKDIPIEAVLKYIKEDRDKYKAKLEQLIPYTKSLEARIKELEKGHSSDITELQQKITKLKTKNMLLTQEKTALIEDLHSTEWFRNLMQSNADKTRRIKTLQNSVCSLIDEINKLKQNTENK